ncbi:MAG TPA: radical SAM protein [Kiritimatiellia bacterium]|nr:radical SAM protein [Kiritimatiellia bacterium]HOM59751.1 radical SAM protein [Kiritimatiellia bacterium]HOR98427.1 radical SAM protein [Kiritimatiellia bacterium]HPC48688.1 radical SAM protein [Kiritimatiellia bacterium]HPW75591.1 radical SAM protein [Kiritimatiellia bacterium]
MPSPRYLFGPVTSRRYGRSLGVDLAAPKTCTLNCRFCQLGPTSATTVTRTDSPPIGEVIGELRVWLASGQTAAFITASGSGEPTLHRRFGDLLRFARDETPCRSLLLSNGTLFGLPEVRREAAQADVVKLSLHAWDQASFEQITRPHPSLRFETILNGYRAFRQEFGGQIDLEVFLIHGVNDSPEQAQRIAALARQFGPDTLTLNTAVRPPADSGVTACPQDRMRALAPEFGPDTRISGAEPPTSPVAFTTEALASLVSRHPVSLNSLAATFALTEEEMSARLAPLVAQRAIRLFETRGVVFAGPPVSEDQEPDDGPPQ